MGARSHIVIESAGTVPVILYGHWAGERNLEAVKEAEQAGARMQGDPEYLTASLFHFFAKDHNGVTGYGISASHEIQPNELDCNYSPVYVNADTGEYRLDQPWLL